MSHRE